MHKALLTLCTTHTQIHHPFVFDINMLTDTMVWKIPLVLEMANAYTYVGN
jgi:hypothetical protein